MAELMHEGTPSAPRETTPNKRRPYHTTIQNRVLNIRVIGISGYSTTIVTIPRKATNSRDDPHI
jgi:hypothetical protein